MQDSYVIVWHGPRRGGKTISQSTQSGIDMINGRNVWSNYPIAFSMRWNFDHILHFYSSQPLDYQKLLHQDPQFEGGVISWDEPALWLFSRNFNSRMNKMFSLIITLMGKLEMNYYFTCQFLSLLDKNIRLQMDALIFCSDLSFKYRQLERGSTIGQLLQDMSGRFTGEMYEYTNMVYQQTFFCKPFWPIYNTKATFDVMEAWNTSREIKQSDLEGAYEKNGEYQYTQEESYRIKLEHLITGLKAENKMEIAPSEFWRGARNIGVNLTLYKGEQLIRDLGVDISGERGKPVYRLTPELVLV